MKKIAFFQIVTARFIIIYVVFNIFVIYYSILAYQIIKRKRQRLNLIFSGFFICTIISLILNMIYGAITDETTILILNFWANFFISFGPIFILIVNLIILESTIIFSIKRQNKYIIIYGIILLVGMLIFYILDGVRISESGIIWTPLFFIFIVFVITGFAVIPIIITSIKIYNSFTTEALKKKWFCYLIGAIGSFSIAYVVFVNNLMNYYRENPTFDLIFSLYGITVIIWVSLMYYGIGYRLKK